MAPVEDGSRLAARSGRHVPQPRLVRRLPGAGPGLQRAWRDRLEAEPVRFLTRRPAAACSTRRGRRSGRFLGADPDGLAFVPNATTGVNTVLQSLRFEPGDELLTNDHEYNATLNALRAVAARDGAAVVVARIPLPDRRPRRGARRDPRRGHAAHPARRSSATSPARPALVLPVARARRRARTRAASTRSSTRAHAPGMVPVDVDALGAAYWTGNGHKWLCGPKGTAVLWVREPTAASGSTRWSCRTARTPSSAAGSRFRHEFDWVGTADPTGYLALPAAIDWMRDVAAPDGGGWPAVMAANHALALAGRDLARRRRSGSRRRRPTRCSASMAALPLCRASPHDAADALHDSSRDRGRGSRSRSAPGRSRPPATATASRRILVRISAQRYNEPADYERLAAALRRRTQAAAIR